MHPDQKRDHCGRVVGQILNDLCPSIGSNPQRAAMHLFWQNGEYLNQERHGGHIVTVSGRAKTESWVNTEISRWQSTILNAILLELLHILGDKILCHLSNFAAKQT